jgi:hypothetical protein
MRFRSRFIALFSLSLLALALADGCSQQGEGERCDLAANGDADCQSGLVCKKASLLQLGSDQTDRCCPPGPSTDARCAPNVGGTAGSGTGGSGGSPDAGPDGAGQAGAP